jgi:hypothetical protein
MFFLQPPDEGQYYGCLWERQTKGSKWFVIGDTDTPQKTSDQWLKSQRDVYMCVSFFAEQGDPHTRGKACDSAGIWGLWLDIDLQSPHRSRSDLPKTMADARLLLSMVPIQPSLVIHSGYGLQPWWLFKEPWVFTDADDRTNAARLAGAWNELFRIRALSRGWGVDGVADLARVMRVPGTKNFKGALPLDVEIVEDNAFRYNPSDFSDIIPAEAWEAKRGLSDPGFAVNIDVTDSPPMPKKFAALCANIDGFAPTWNHTKQISDTSMSGYDLAIANYAVMAGMSDQEICDLLICHAVDRNAPVKPPGYYQRTIAKAREGSRMGLRPESGCTKDDIIPQLKEINILGPDGAYEARTKVFDLLTLYWGLQIYDFIAYLTDPREYELKTDRGSVMFPKGQDDIASGPAFRKRVADITKVYVDRMETAEWDVLIQALRFASREQEIGSDLTEIGMANDWVSAYVSTHPPMEEKEMNEAIKAGMPFRRGGYYYFHMDPFRQWLSSRGERISSQKLGAKLTRAGVMARTVNYSKDGNTRSTISMREVKDDAEQ